MKFQPQQQAAGNPYLGAPLSQSSAWTTPNVAAAMRYPSSATGIPSYHYAAPSIQSFVELNLEFASPATAAPLVVLDHMHAQLLATLQEAGVPIAQGVSQEVIEQCTTMHQYEIPKDPADIDKCAVCLCEYEDEEQVC